MDAPLDLDHPAFLTGISTAVAYGVLLAVMFALLFVLPWLVYTTLG